MYSKSTTDKEEESKNNNYCIKYNNVHIHSCRYVSVNGTTAQLQNRNV